MRPASRVLQIPVTVLLCIALLSCGRLSTKPPPVAPQDLPTAAPEAPPTTTGTAYRIVPEASYLRILVMRGGPLGRFGHNHVVGGQVITGQASVHEKLSESRFELEIDLTSLQVDLPQWRAEEGEDFASDLDPADIVATRNNMLGDKVLDAARYPVAKVQSVAVLGQLPEFSVLARLSIREQSRSIPVPVRMEMLPTGLTASGEFTLTQSDFGIEPFSILLGAISVQDDLKVRFKITAIRVD